MTEKMGSQFPVQFMVKGSPLDFPYQFDMDIIYPQIEAALPEAIRLGKRTDPMRIGVKALIGYLIREVKMARTDDSYPDPPLKAINGGDIVLQQLQYLVGFLGALLNVAGGITIQCDLTNGEIRIIGMEIGTAQHELGTNGDGDERPTLPEGDGQGPEATGSRDFPGGPVDDHGDDREREDDLWS